MVAGFVLCEVLLCEVCDSAMRSLRLCYAKSATSHHLCSSPSETGENIVYTKSQTSYSLTLVASLPLCLT
jgi:hypothetical protein